MDSNAEAVEISEPHKLLKNCRQVQSIIERHTELPVEGGVENPSHDECKVALASTSTIEASETGPAEAHTGSPLKDALDIFRVMISRANGVSFAEDVSPDDTIQSLKVRIESARGFPIPSQILKHEGNLLEDFKTVR